MKRAFQSSIFFLCVLFSVAGAYNVIADNAEVERLAQETACKGEPPSAADARAPRPADPGSAPGCRAQKTRMERTPLAQTFDFALPKKQVTVRCARGAVLVGDYACELR